MMESSCGNHGLRRVPPWTMRLSRKHPKELSGDGGAVLLGVMLMMISRDQIWDLMKGLLVSVHMVHHHHGLHVIRARIMHVQSLDRITLMWSLMMSVITHSL